MTHTYRIKNMVCDRCKTVLKQELENAGIGILSIELGGGIGGSGSILGQ